MNEVLILIIGILAFSLYFALKSHFSMKRKLLEVVSKKQSLSTRYGKMTEQFMPLLDLYPYDEHNFRFLGTPVDGVQFNDDGIVFVEFKSAESKMTRNQRDIKDLIERNKVFFKEIRLPTACKTKSMMR